jgi:Flp pilus assembly protein TadG
MKPPAIRRHCNPCSRRQEHGVTMVLVAIALVAIIAIAALSIDVITLYLAREEAQRSADAAALAAARVISISGLTGDPNNSSNLWQTICNSSSSPASMAATAVATQSAVGGTVPSPPLVTYSAGGVTSSDCGVLGPAFGVNPLVTVQVTRTGLPTFFSRIWGNTGNSVSATATAEVLNPSASDADINGGATGSVTPVQPSCVKPWMIPNQNPYTAACTGGAGGTCPQFVSLSDGTIQNPGIQLVTPTGVVGETFTLFADCGTSSPCPLVNPQPQANILGVTTGFSNGPPPVTPNLEYLPGLAPPSSVAVPTCAVGSSGNPEYAAAVAGCDENTVYQCGVQSSTAATPNSIDLSENPAWPGPGETASAVACLLTNSTTVPLTTEDVMDRTVYPFKITAGSGNPLGAGVSGSAITSSNSIMSFPIYDSSGPGLIFTGSTANVTIVGFLQVFVNNVNSDGSLNVTVLNVAGCGNNASNRAVTGSSPVPIRLVTPP